jgi:hypothetical protein
MTVPPSTNNADAIDGLFKALKAANVLADLDYLQVYQAHDAQAGYRNWLANAVNAQEASGTVPFTQGVGMLTTPGNIFTWFNVTASGNKFTRDSAHFGIATADVDNASDVAAAGFRIASPAYGVTINPRASDGSFRFRINQGAETVLTPPDPTAVGVFAIDRSGPSAGKAYRNGVLIGSTNQPSAALQGMVLRMGNVSDGVRGLLFRASFAGRSMSDAKHAAMAAALSTYSNKVSPSAA